MIVVAKTSDQISTDIFCYIQFHKRKDTFVNHAKIEMIKWNKCIQNLTKFEAQIHYKNLIILIIT